MSRTLKELLNSVLAQSSFVQKDQFAGSADPDDIQMVEFANRAVDEIRRFFPWGLLRKSTQVTLVDGQLAYDLPTDFDYYNTDTMWKSYGARHVVIPTDDQYWSFIKAGNPGTRINYYAKILNGKLTFTAVTPGDIINYDYMSNMPVEDIGMNPKARFDTDTDTCVFEDDTLVMGIKAFWKLEKEMPSGQFDYEKFHEYLRRDIGKDTPAKVVRPREEDMHYPFTPPIDSKYVW